MPELSDSETIWIGSRPPRRVSEGDPGRRQNPGSVESAEDAFVEASSCHFEPDVFGHC